MANIPETEKCRKCGKRSYPAESVMMEKQLWHQDCLRCVDPSCNKKLAGANWGGFVQPDNSPYCNVHHKRLRQASGSSASFTGSTSLPAASAPSATSDAPSAVNNVPEDQRCRKCAKRVYPAEAVLMDKQLWHQDCLRCSDPVCNKKLAGANWGGFVPPDNKPYCSIHLKRLVISGGTSTTGSTASPTQRTTSTPSNVPENERCKKCGKRSYPAESILIEKQLWHQDCLRCVDPSCNKKISGANWGGFVPPDNSPYCSVHHKRLLQAAGSSAAFSGSTVGSKWNQKNAEAASAEKQDAPAAQEEAKDEVAAVNTDENQ